MKLATATLAAVLATAAARDSGVRPRRRLQFPPVAGLRALMSRRLGCYDMVVHKCSCTDANCDIDKCTATGGYWTEQCPGEPCTCANAESSEDSNQSEASSQSEDSNQETVEACYDTSVHQCSCTDANCDADKCTATGGVWTDGCSGEKCECASSDSQSEDSNQSDASYDEVAGYKPSSEVDDQCAIDLEQAAMEAKMNGKTEEAFVEGRAVYNDGADGDGGRTLAGLSTSAGTEMAGDRHFKYFARYYGHDDYAHRWVEAAFTGAPTSFRRGDADFSQYGILGRLQGVKKGTAYMTVLMSALHEVASAAEECADGNAAARRAWDAAWCYYAGSLEGKDGAGAGKLAYGMADARCANFRTCGDDGDKARGTAKVNIDLLDLFSAGNTQLRDGDCVGARATADRVADLMYLGVLQGTLRYAYKVSAVEGGTDNEVWKAEGAVFAAAVLPRIHAASPAAAAIIYDNERVGAPTTDYIAVKTAFESTYPALGLTCADVGGYWDADAGAYFDGMEPCTDSEESSQSEASSQSEDSNESNASSESEDSDQPDASSESENSSQSVASSQSEDSSQSASSQSEDSNSDASSESENSSQSVASSQSEDSNRSVKLRVGRPQLIGRPMRSEGYGGTNAACVRHGVALAVAAHGLTVLWLAF